MAQPRGFVCAEQRADKCRLLLTIYTLLHTPAHVRVTQKCARSAAVAPLVPFAPARASIHRTPDMRVRTCVRAQDEHAYSISVSISVKGRDGKNPCEHITLTEIWPLSHPSSAHCVRIQRLTQREREEEGLRK